MGAGDMRSFLSMKVYWLYYLPPQTIQPSSNLEPLVYSKYSTKQALKYKIFCI